MKDNVFFLLIFGIVLVGITLFFINFNYSSEGFQDAASIPTIVESDKFLNERLSPQVVDFKGYSTLFGIKEQFKVYVTDWHNFSGNKDRTRDINPLGDQVRKNKIVYTDYYGDSKEERINMKDIIVNREFNNGAGSASLKWNLELLLYSQGQTSGQRGVGIDNDSTNIPTNSLNIARDLNIPRTLLTTFINSFNNFLTSATKNKTLILRQFLQNLNISDIYTFTNKINKDYYLSRNLYNFGTDSGAANWRSPDVKVAGVGGRQEDINYNVGVFRGNDFPLLSILDKGTQEKLRLNVYGTLCNYHRNDFIECLEYGCSFDFKETTLLDMYLNIPFYGKKFNGIDIYYSYGFFLPEIKAISSSEYRRNQTTILHNKTLTDGVTNTTIVKPRNNNCKINWGDNATVNSLSCDETGFTSPIPLTSLPTPNQRIVGKITPLMLSKLPNMMNRFVTSWCYNRTIRMLDVNLEDIATNGGNNIDKAAYLMELAYNNWSDTTGELKQSWSNYLTTYLYRNVRVTTYVGGYHNSHYGWYNNNLASGQFSEGGYRMINPEINALAHAIYLRDGNRLTANGGTGMPFGTQFRRSDNRFWVTVADTSTTGPNEGVMRFSVSDTANYNNHIYYKTTPNITKPAGQTHVNPLIVHKTTFGSEGFNDLNDETIGNMKTDFTVLIEKMRPDYGIAKDIKILDEKFLNSIAQSFYEYSDGLFEIVMIYDVYKIGSNMLDIRFDKRQRLGPMSYITLRNRYQPKVAQYNNLIEMYEQNTWKGTYNDVDEVLSNISTVKQELEPVFNPVYTIGNRNPADIKADISRLEESNIILERQLKSGNTAITTGLTGTTDSNVRNDYIRNLLNSPDSALLDATLIQSKIDSNENILYSLSNQLEGIETNVARIFYTMSSTSNIIVNGVALGVNAALSYNTMFNGGLNIDMGSSQGNVNYEPIILYTKNLTPNLDHTNIDFIKRASQLYMDSIFINLSNFTSNVYKEQEGFIRVDKIFGTKKFDDKTIGFTWQESQYDFYTNEPKKRRINNVVLKFAFDNSEYQNPQLYIENQVSNIYLTSNIVDSTFSNSLNTNRILISNYQSKIPILNAERELFNSNNQGLPELFSNFLLNALYYYTDSYDEYYRSRDGISPMGPVFFKKDIIKSNRFIDDYRTLFGNTTYTYSNFRQIYDLRKLGDMNSGVTTEIIPTIYDYPTEYQYYNATQLRYNSYIWRRNQPKRNVSISYGPTDGMLKQLVERYEYNLNNISNRRNQIQEYTNMISNLEEVNRNLSSNINSNLSNGMFKFDRFTNNNGAVFSSNDFIKYFNHIENLPIPVESNIRAYVQASNRYTTALSNFNSTTTSANYLSNPRIYSNSYISQQTQVSNFSNSMNTIIIPNLFTTINYSALTVKLFYELDEIILDNNDGACPDNMVCGNPIIMSQLTDAYNFDSNNKEKITRIFKAFTPNPSRCDYLVEMANSNGVVKKGTIAFEVGQDIEDCSYYITSNFGFNKGYYIIDKVNFVEDNTGTDISGFNYVGNALYGYSNSLVDTLSPLMNNATNILSTATNAIGISRLNTFEALGRINKMTIKNNCPVITYDSLYTLIKKEEFHDYIFRTYSFYSNHMSKIICAGIFSSNMFDITYNSIELEYSSNKSINVVSEKLQGARYMVSTSTSFCDFYPIFMCNVPALPSKEVLNLSNMPTNAYYNSNITSNLNIINPSQFSCRYLDVTSFKVQDLIMRFRGNTVTSETVRVSLNTNNIIVRGGTIIHKINSYLRVDLDKVIFNFTYKNTVGASSRYNTLADINENVIFEFNKDINNQPYIKTIKVVSSNELLYYTRNFGSMEPYTNPHGYVTSNQTSNIGGVQVTTEILRDIDVNPRRLLPQRYSDGSAAPPRLEDIPTQANTIQYIKEYIGVKTIHDNRWGSAPVLSFNNTVLPSKINILNTFQTEIIILSNVDEMPVYRTNLLVRGYYVSASKIEIFDIIPVNYPLVPTLFINLPANTNNMLLINSFRNLYNFRNKNTSNYSELSKVYRLDYYVNAITNVATCEFAASVYYKNSSNIYNLNILPNDIRYNNLKYFRVTYFSHLNKRLGAIDYEELGIYPLNRPRFNIVNDTNPIEQSNFSYFMSNLKFNSFIYQIEPSPLGSYELAQIEFYNGIFKHNITNLNSNYTDLPYTPTQFEIEYNYTNYIYEAVGEYNGIYDSRNIWKNTSGTLTSAIPLTFQIPYNFLTNSQNIDISADNEPQVYTITDYHLDTPYPFNINQLQVNNILITLSNSINITGYSIVLGGNRDSFIKNWKLYGTTGTATYSDGKPIYFELHSINNYSNITGFPFGIYYRTPIFSLVGTSNIPLVQYPFYEKSMEECGISVINSNIIDYTVNSFPFSIIGNKFADIKNLLSYYYDGRFIYLGANIFIVEDIPPLVETLTTVIIKVRIKTRENCSQTFRVDTIVHNITAAPLPDIDPSSEEYNEALWNPTYLYSNLTIPSTYTPIPNYTYISNILYEHTRKGKYTMCSNNPIRTDSIEPLFALFELIYFYGTPESDQVLADNFTAQFGIIAPFINNPVSNDLESLNILYSKIRSDRNSISYILSVNSYDITSGNVLVNGYYEWQDRIVSPTPVLRRFVYSITSPYFTDCTNITYVPTFNRIETGKLNTQSLTSYASSNGFTAYSSSNTLTNIKRLHIPYEIKKISEYYPTPQTIISEVYSNNSLNQIFSNYNFNGKMDSRFGFSYYKINEDFSYDIIINNISFKKIYKYEDLDSEGRIYYTDTIPFNYIWNLYELSNIPTYINESDVPFSNLSNIYHLRVKLSDTTIENLYLRLRRREFQNISEAGVQTITDITNVNLTNYVTTNNFISNSNYQIYTFSSGDTNTISMFNSNSYNIESVKSNCQINFTNPSMLNKFFTYGSDGQYQVVVPQFSQDIYNAITGVDELGNPVDLNPFTMPIIAYGKENSNDALRYNYILKMSDTLDRTFYTDFSIKFYYGSNPNRIYRRDRKLFLQNPDNLCSYNTNITLSRVLNSSELSEYVLENNYENLFKNSVEYQNLILLVSRCAARLVEPLSPTFINSIYGEQGFSPVPLNAPIDYDPIYTKLTYYKNNLEELANNYVFSIYTANNITYYLEYSLQIGNFTNCRDFTITPTYYRSLNYSNMLQLSNSNYTPYFDGIDIERNLSNCGVNYNSIFGYEFGPLSDNTLVNIMGTIPTIGDIDSSTILYKRYRANLGIVDYSYLLQINSLYTVEYSIYFLYAPSSNCSIDTISNYNYINPSIITNTADYALENSYINVTPIVTMTDTQKMSLYNINASNPTLINFINNNLSNIRINPTYSNNLVSINYTKTDYPNVRNSYVIGVWPPTTTLTLDSLINTPRNYLQYNITLSNIQSSSNYTILSSIPTVISDPPDDFSVYLNNVYYKNGVRLTTNFYELGYTPSNCYPTYSASNLIPTVQTLGIDGILPTNLSDTIRGYVAYKNNNTTLTFDYIVEVLKDDIYYYPVIRVRLGTPSSTPTDCTTSYINENETFLVPTYVSNITYANLGSYITTNGFTSNIGFTTQAPAPATGGGSTPDIGTGGGEGTTPDPATGTGGGEGGGDPDSFKNYERIERKKQVYSIILFQAENSFKISNFKLYTFNDIEIPLNIIKQNNNSIYFQNTKNLQIRGYSFITNSISSEYDPKSWIIKATNDGRKWNELDSKSMRNSIERNYQLPIIYFNGKTKALPQPVSKQIDKPKVEKIDKETLIKYYKQKINSSIKPDYKKYMRDNDTYYFLYDEYDLNRNLVGKDLIIGLILKNGNVKKSIMYEDDEGNYLPFDLKKEKIKNYWNKKIMLPLLFQDF